MSIVKPLTVAQLQAFETGLRQDLSVIQSANNQAKLKLAEIRKPENLQKYRPDAIAEMCRAATERFQRTVLSIVKTLPEREKAIEAQQKYWDEDYRRDSTLYPRPPQLKIGDSISLLRTERDVQTLAELTAFNSHTLMENTGRLWQVREFELMHADRFIKTVEDASEQGQAAILYIARLVADTRTWPTEEGSSRARAALAKAEVEIKLPERTQSLEILQTCAELVSDIESAWISLSTGKDDIRSKVRPYAEERKAREAAEKAAEEEAKRRLEAVEENLILKGQI